MIVLASCHCGSVRYEADVDPQGTGICHCKDCQKLTGSAYRISVPAKEGSLTLLAGQPSVYIKVGDSGARRAQAFCSTCGSPLYTCDVDNPRTFGLRVGCIDEREVLIPRKQKWCQSALTWTQSLVGLDRQERE